MSLLFLPLPSHAFGLIIVVVSYKIVITIWVLQVIAKRLLESKQNTPHLYLSTGV